MYLLNIVGNKKLRDKAKTGDNTNQYKNRCSKN